MSITEYLESQLGQEQQWVFVRPNGNETHLHGIVDKYEILGYNIMNLRTHKQWPAYRLRIKPMDGGRAVWTKSLPFKEEDTPTTEHEEEGEG